MDESRPYRVPLHGLTTINRPGSWNQLKRKSKLIPVMDDVDNFSGGVVRDCETTEITYNEQQNIERQPIAALP